MKIEINGKKVPSPKFKSPRVHNEYLSGEKKKKKAKSWGRLPKLPRASPVVIALLLLHYFIRVTCSVGESCSSEPLAENK